MMWNMKRGSGTEVEPLRVPSGLEAQKVVADYLVYYETRLPELRARAERIRANLRWIAEGGYKVPGAKPPFEV